MSRRLDPGTLALRTLALVRLTNGLLGLLAPAVLSRRTSEDPDSTAPYYAFRMFGIRTVVLGADLLLLRGEALQRARTEAVLIHACDTICAVVGGARGDLPRRMAVVITVVSATNTLLAVVARIASPPPDRTSLGRHRPLVTCASGGVGDAIA